MRGKIFKRDSADNITQVLMISQDITERRKNEHEVLELKDQIARKAEEQLKQSESLLAMSLKLCPLAWDF
ncbi:hypothetical protein LWM68_21885 [Niabella sp. W65]|nr:hypothetical protein [Niabella sp. W65]MCH7365181.1 hypothetical protein [Niabella sp. W65]